jgi:hypothetical protein
MKEGETPMVENECKAYSHVKKECVKILKKYSYNSQVQLLLKDLGIYCNLNLGFITKTKA